MTEIQLALRRTRSQIRRKKKELLWLEEHEQWIIDRIVVVAADKPDRDPSNTKEAAIDKTR